MKKTFIIILIALTLSACGSSSPSEKEDVITADFSTASVLMSDSSSKYDELKTTLPGDEAKPAMVTWLKGQADIEDAGLSEDRNNIWFNTKDGINMNILTYSNPYTSESMVKEMTKPDLLFLDKSISKAPATSLPGASWIYMYVPFLWEQTDACRTEGFFEDDIDIGNCDSIEDFPYTDLSGIRDLTKYYIDPNSGLSFYSVPYINEQADIEMLSSILMMGITQDAHIFIHTHGGVSSHDGQDFAFFLTSETLTSGDYENKFEDLVHGRLSLVEYAGTAYYAITPTYISEHLKEIQSTLGIEPHFQVYVSACKNYHDSMIKAFTENGADSFIGYTGLATHDFVYSTTMSLYSSFASGKSITEAVNELSPRFDPTNFGTMLNATVSSSKERYFYRMFMELGEESLETPPAQKMTVTVDEEGGIAVGGILTTPPEDKEKTGHTVGSITITFPAINIGEYKIEDIPGASITINDNSDGKQWIASKECIEDDPLCLCSGTITIDYADTDSGGVVEGTFTAVLVDKDNVTTTKEVSGTFTAVR